MTRTRTADLILVASRHDPESTTKRPTKRAPKDFEASESVLEFGRQHGFSESEILDEIAAFKDHEFARAKKDWPATFRNWLRKSKQWKSERPQKKLTYAERLAEDIQKFDQADALEQTELIEHVADE